jgi:hypothetical protein
LHSQGNECDPQQVTSGLSITQELNHGYRLLANKYFRQIVGINFLPLVAGLQQCR